MHSGADATVCATNPLTTLGRQRRRFMRKQIASADVLLQWEPRPALPDTLAQHRDEAWQDMLVTHSELALMRVRALFRYLMHDSVDAEHERGGRRGEVSIGNSSLQNCRDAVSQHRHSTHHLRSQ